MALEDNYEEARQEPVNLNHERERIEALVWYFRRVQHEAAKSGRSVAEIEALDWPIARLRAGLPLEEAPGPYATKAPKLAIDHNISHAFPEPWDQVRFNCQNRLLTAPYLNQPFPLVPREVRLLDKFILEPFRIFEYQSLEPNVSLTSLTLYVCDLRLDLTKVFSLGEEVVPQFLPNTKGVGWSLLHPSLKVLA